jgi:hypothetical protein
LEAIGFFSLQGRRASEQLTGCSIFGLFPVDHFMLEVPQISPIFSSIME